MADDPGFPSRVRWDVELPSAEAKDSEFGGCRNIEEVYSRDSQIGEGTYGEVFLGTCKQTGEKVALKKTRMDNEKEGFPITAIREIKLLKLIEHENVITLKEIVRSRAHVANNMKGSIYMVFDYMDHDLTGLMERRNYKMEISHIKCYMKQLLRGLHFCHGRNILHRDLKASNLLINNEGILKIADFGLARTKDETTQKGRLTNRVITLWYRPPELILGASEYGPEIDMWSVGCIFAELLAGQPLFPGKDETDQLDRICKVMGTPTEETMPGVSRLSNAHMLAHRYKENRLEKHLRSKKITDPHALDLLGKLLEMNPEKRMSAQAAFGHQYFWEAPMPAEPKDLPRYAASHELDMKKLRQEGKSKHGPPAAHAVPAAKRPRHADAPGPRAHDLAPHHPHGGQQHDGRAAPPRQGGGYRGETHGGHADQRPSTSGRHYDGRYPDQRPATAAAGGYPQGYAGGPYGAGPPGFGGSYPGANFGPGSFPLGYDSTGYPLPNHPASQAYKGHAPQQPELGAAPSWASQKR